MNFESFTGASVTLRLFYENPDIRRDNNDGFKKNSRGGESCENLVGVTIHKM